MKKYIIIFLLILFIFSLNSEEKQNIDVSEVEKYYKEFIQSDALKRKEMIEKIDTTLATSLLDYIRYKKIKENQENEIIFHLYEHLANMKAIELSQKRLNKLLTVIILMLILFTGYVSFILHQQNKIIREIKNKYNMY